DVEVEAHSALGRLVELAEQEGDDHGVVIVRDEAIGELLPFAGRGHDQTAGLVDASEFEQRQQGVQPVAVLVGLGTEGVAEG
ncbi:hypothetical protein COJ21_24720, partial [Priestia megaterium]